LHVTEIRANIITVCGAVGGKPPEEVGRTLQLTQSIQLKEINVDEELVKERNEDLNRINKDVAELVRSEPKRAHSMKRSISRKTDTAIVFNKLLCRPNYKKM
jgi:hypothetical protein